MEGLVPGGAGRGQGQPVVDTQLTVTSQALRSPRPPGTDDPGRGRAA